jgi:glycogen operon protein
MRDLVSYNEKHNEANGEDNRDGSDDNLSWNHGEEGETTNPEVNDLRERQQRNMLATLMVSQGVPMVLHGDEVGRTQRGNNNGYAQDNEITWQSWDLESWQKNLLAWTQRVVAMRASHPVLRRRNYFRGRPIRGAEVKDIAWLTREGREMTEDEWNDENMRSLGIYLAGMAADLIDEEGRAIAGDTLVILLNSSPEGLEFRLPASPQGMRWALLLDSAFPALGEGVRHFRGGGRYPLQPRSLAVLKHPSRQVNHAR